MHINDLGIRIFLCASLLMAPQSALAETTETNDAPSLAKVTEAKGTVYKRGFVDFNKEAWGNPEPATKGDRLNEGMQLGTGDKSWAQLAWKNCTTRAWSNSVYAVAPNQRLVYVVGGEVLFQLDKKRKDKSEYVIWTNLLQARVRGTTVLVQSTSDNSKISVLEGTIDVINRIDKSVVSLKPGVVLEIQSKDAAQSAPLSGNLLSPTWTAQIGNGLPTSATVGSVSTLLTSPTGTVTQLTNTLTDTAGNLVNTATGTVGGVLDTTAKTLGETTKAVDAIASTATGGLVNTNQQLGGVTHTVSNIADSLSSGNVLSGVFSEAGNPKTFATEMILPGMKKTEVFETLRTSTNLYSLNARNLMASPILAGFDNQLPSTGLIQSALNTLPSQSRLLNNRSEIIRMPVMLSYGVGPTVGKLLPLPTGAATNWPPSAIIGSQTSLNNTLQAVGGALQAVGNNPGQGQRVAVRFSDIVLGPQLPGGGAIPGGTNVTSILARTDTVALMNGGALGVPLGGVGGVLGSGGVLGGVNGLLNGVGGLLGGLGGGLGGLGGGLGGLGGGLGLGGLGLGGLGGGLGGLLGFPPH